MFGEKQRRIQELEREVDSLKKDLEKREQAHRDAGAPYWKKHSDYRSFYISPEGRRVANTYRMEDERFRASLEGDPDILLGEFISLAAAKNAVEKFVACIQKGAVVPRRQGNRTVYVSGGGSSSSGDSGPGFGTGMLFGLVAASAFSHSHDHQQPAFSGAGGDSGGAGASGSFDDSSSSSDSSSSDSSSSDSSSSCDSGSSDSGPSSGGSD